MEGISVDIISQVSAGSIVGIIAFIFGANMIPGIPEDVAVLLVGSVVSLSPITFRTAALVVVGTLFVSDNLLYVFSRKGARIFVKIKNKIFGDDFDVGGRGIVKRLPLIIIISRFLFQVRFIGPFLAGVNKMPWQRFALYDLFALLLYVPFVMLVGHYFGDRVERIISGINVAGNYVTIGLVVFASFIIFLVLKKMFKFWLKKESSMDDSGIGIERLRGNEKK